METGKVEFAPDHESGKKYPDMTKVYQRLRQRHEYQQLRDAVVETATSWYKGDEQQADKRGLKDAIKALITFEPEHNIK
jgi:hypothetical protein